MEYFLEQTLISSLNQHAHNLAQKFADQQIGDVVKIDLTSVDNHVHYHKFPCLFLDLYIM